MSTNPVLEVTKLRKNYGSFVAVDDLSFSIAEGEVVGLLGPNGAGKSTTIQMLLGLLSPTGGSINYFGLDFNKQRRRILKRINYLSAFNRLQEKISVQENLNVFALAYEVSDAKARISELLDYFEVTHLKNNRYSTLSAGQRTRVNLVKTFLNKPEIVLMDEPTASLDPDIVDRVLTMLESLKQQSKLSLLFTSHNMAEVERVCDRVIFLGHGKLIKETPKEELSNLHSLFLQIAREGEED